MERYLFRLEEDGYVILLLDPGAYYELGLVIGMSYFQLTVNLTIDKLE